jgi:hypothetical protein
VPTRKVPRLDEIAEDEKMQVRKRIIWCVTSLIWESNLNPIFQSNS